ncbi:HNH endonuclease signature motif containing protein [Paenibacillus sp. FSL M7-0547]|uniref:HNH endonuclease signature motif containing protein n=1 Tax=Paenibacillus sp. FSL M7-0547 TaxID=2954755 RepID=UPI0030F8E3C9
MRKRNALEFIEDGNGCFITTSHRLNKDGYCYIRNNYRQVRAHRLVYEECFGEIPVGMVVRHKCDTRNCINPEHLELGTPKDNTYDCINRGRKALGEKSNTAKITEDTARQIKRLIREGNRNFEITKQLNVTIDIVRKIRESKTWKYVS